MKIIKSSKFGIRIACKTEILLPNKVTHLFNSVDKVGEVSNVSTENEWIECGPT